MLESRISGWESSVNKITETPIDKERSEMNFLFNEILFRFFRISKTKRAQHQSVCRLDQICFKALDSRA